MNDQKPLTLCLAGRFAALKQNQIRVRLNAQGVRVPSAYDPFADAILIADRAAASVADRAARDGLQILREADLGSLWRGEPFAALLRRRCLEPAAPAPPNDILATLRGLLHDEPSPRTWSALCQLLDQADQSVQQLAADYALPRLLSWPLEDDNDDVATWLRPPRAWLRALLDGAWSPRLALIPALDLNTAPPKRVEALAARLPELHWPGLRALSFQAIKGLGHFKALAQAPAPPNLTHLSVHGWLDPNPLVELLRGPLTDHLRHLHAPRLYRDNPLWGLPLVERLHALQLTSYEGPAEVLPRVRHLRRFAWHADANRAWALADQQHLHHPWPALESLWLTRQILGRNGLERLLKNDSLERLTSLRLTHCQTGHRALGALARAQHLRRLRRLELTLCNIGDNGAVELARAAPLASLERLELGNNPLTAAAAAPLASAPFFRALRHLDLRASSCGDALLERVARHPAPLALEHLDLTWARVTNDGVRYLLLTENLPHLRRLLLGGNTFGAQALDDLRRRYPQVEIIA